MQRPSPSIYTSCSNASISTVSSGPCQVFLISFLPVLPQLDRLTGNDSIWYYVFPEAIDISMEIINIENCQNMNFARTRCDIKKVSTKVLNYGVGQVEYCYFN